MTQESKIFSLIQLLDDPDLEVYEPVSTELLEIGMEATTFLQAALQEQSDALFIDRATLLLGKIRLEHIKKELLQWKSGEQNLLEAMLIINKIAFPELNEQELINKIEDLRREAWIQMHDYEHSPLEYVEILNRVFFVEHQFVGNHYHQADPNCSYLKMVLEKETGNQLSLSVLYMIVAQKLNLPIYGVNLPQHFILAYTDTASPSDVFFYINVYNNGEVFSRNAINDFLKQLSLEPSPEFFIPCDNEVIIVRALRNLLNSYTMLKNHQKVEEIKELIDILSPSLK